MVHGDYFYDNLLVGEDLKISAVLDFSDLSVVGDHKMDITGALIYLTLDTEMKHKVDYIIPNLDQPATNTKKVSTITDPRKRVSSL